MGYQPLSPTSPFPTYAAKTVPVALAAFSGRHSVNWGMLVTGGLKV